jgi:hypothetical protein
MHGTHRATGTLSVSMRKADWNKRKKAAFVQNPGLRGMPIITMQAVSAAIHSAIAVYNLGIS